MPMPIQMILAALLLGGLLWWALRASGLGIGKRSKCADCVHCRKLFDDGTLCGFGPREVFKNEVQVNNCVDHRARLGRTAARTRGQT